VNALRTDQDRIDDDVLTGDAFTTTRLIDYLPGLALLIGVGLLGKYAEVWWLAAAKHEHWTVPDIEYVLWAILIGLVITNTVGLHRVFRPGVLTYHFWLKVGIVGSDRALCLATCSSWAPPAWCRYSSTWPSPAP
jgi:integral membrane protein